MLTIYRNDRGTVFDCLAHHDIAGYYQRFLIGKPNPFTFLNRFQRRLQSRKANDTRQHHIIVVEIRHFHQSGLTCKYFYIRGCQCVFYRFIFCFITNNNRIGIKLQRLFDQQFMIGLRSQYLRLKQFSICADHFKRLRTDRTGRTK